MIGHYWQSSPLQFYYKLLPSSKTQPFPLYDNELGGLIKGK